VVRRAVTALAVGTALTALAVALLYAVLRRAGERWWLWGTATALGLLTLMLLIAPVWINPLFNTYKLVQNVEVKSAVLAMARANGAPVDNVYAFDASHQTMRVSANVSGIFGSAAMRLNDNLLRRSSLPEIRAVMAHELEHWVMNHIYKALAEFALLFLAAFLFAQWCALGSAGRKRCSELAAACRRVLDVLLRRDAAQQHPDANRRDRSRSFRPQPGA